MEILASNTVVGTCRWHSPEFQGRSANVVRLGQSILGPTALTNGHDISMPDTFAIDKFFVANRSLSLSSNESLIEHSRFSGDIAFSLAVLVNEKTGSNINPWAQKSALNLHDLGRFGAHSFMETDVLTDIYWGAIGLRKDLKDMTHSAHLYWSDAELVFQKISVSERISIVSDVFGKWSQNEPTRLRHKEEILEAVKLGKQKYLHKSNPTPYEIELVARLPEYTRKEEYAITKTLGWLVELGIDMNVVVDGVLANYKERQILK